MRVTSESWTVLVLTTTWWWTLCEGLWSTSSLIPRAVSDAPSGGYAPALVDCPTDRPKVRDASSLSADETRWLDLRRNNTIDPLRQFLGRMNITDFDASAYIQANRNNASALPNVGIAFSGGGYRALMNGAGAMAAFDDRTPNATNTGQLGGLLQASNYVAGLSGGSWLVGSIFINNFTTIGALQASAGSLWNFDRSIFDGPAKKGISLLNTAEYYGQIADAVTSKSLANFNTSITDYWGRALAYQLINATDGGPAITWSSLAQDTLFAQGLTPMPLVVADGRAPDEILIPSNTTVFEFTPWEFGSFDPTIDGFVPTRYLGTNFSDGRVKDGDRCVRGFDNAGFVMGTSSSLFNQGLLRLNGSNIPAVFKNALSSVLQDLNRTNDDIADFRPNPFYRWKNGTNLSADSTSLTLVDGGSDLQNIPLHPLTQPLRRVDVIFAVDSSADTSNWPNGTALVTTYDRSRSVIDHNISFPAIPDQNTFVNLGLNARPTFFGCNSSNQTGPSPLIVYLPNAPYVFRSNISTFDPASNRSQRDAIILNGYHTVTLANSIKDPQWPACVGCAVLSRSLERTKTKVPAICQTCFKRYCWDGTRNSSTPNPYYPTYQAGAVNVKSAGTRIEVSWLGSVSSFWSMLMTGLVVAWLSI